MEEAGSHPQNTPDLETLVRRNVRFAVRAYINKLAALFGIANFAVVVGVIFYVAQTAPEKAIEMVVKNEREHVESLQRGLGDSREKLGAFKADMTKNEEDISNKLASLKADLDHEFTELDTLKKSIPSLNEKINHINAQVKGAEETLQSLLSASQDDIEKAAHILEFTKKAETSAALLTRMDAIDQSIKTLKGRVNDFASGKVVLDLLSVRDINIKGALHLNDGNDKPRMLLTTDPKDGRAQIALRDAKQNNRVQLYESESGGYLRLYDEGGYSFFNVGITVDNGAPSDPFLILGSSKTKKDAFVVHGDENGGDLILKSKSGENRISFNIYNNGDTPQLHLYDKNGYAFFRAGMYTDTLAPFLSVGNPETKNNVFVATSDDDGGRLDIRSKSGANRLRFYTSKSDVPYLRLYDNNNYNFFTAGIYVNNDIPSDPFLILGGSKTKKDAFVATSNDDGGRLNVYNKEGNLSGFLSAQENGDGFFKLMSHSGKDHKVISP